MWRRRKLRVSWHRDLKQDSIAVEEGFTARLFKHKDVYAIDLAYWDYPSRTVQRSWKQQRKTQYKVK